VVPRNRSIYQVLRFPPQGPVGLRSPASTVLSKHSDSPPSFPPHFVSFAWRYHRAPIVRLSSARSTRLAEAGGFRVRQPLWPLLESGGDDWASHVPGGSSRAYALLCDPGGTDSPGHGGDSVLPPHLSSTKAPTTGLSGLNHTACALAVYASQPRSPERRARLASACRPGFDGRDSNPLDPDERFQLCFLHRFLLSRTS
jgi:hypothetical protein